jgi:hypothetical protein
VPDRCGEVRAVSAEAGAVMPGGSQAAATDRITRDHVFPTTATSINYISPLSLTEPRHPIDPVADHAVARAAFAEAVKLLRQKSKVLAKSRR